jgi:hypothetical protein
METKKGGFNFCLFLSSNFMKLCGNIHRRVWQLWGLKKIQDGSRCHGHQGAINVKRKPYSGSILNLTQNRSSFKVVLFVFKIFKIAANIKIEKNKNKFKNEKISMEIDITGSTTCCTIWRIFWFAMTAILNLKWSPKYKYPPIWATFGFQVDYDVAN